MIYAVQENGEPYSYHLSQAEANKYIEELRKVYPLSDWELQPLTTGRLRGQSVMLWGSECLVDALDGTFHQFMKVYIWKDKPWLAPALHAEVYRYLPMNFEDTGESDCKRIAKQRMRGMRFEAVDGTTDRVIRVE